MPLLLERMRILDVAHSWSQGTHSAYQPKLRFLREMEDRFSGLCTLPREIPTAPPHGPAMPLASPSARAWQSPAGLVSRSSSNRSPERMTSDAFAYRPASTCAATNESKCSPRLSDVLLAKIELLSSGRFVIAPGIGARQRRIGGPLRGPPLQRRPRVPPHRDLRGGRHGPRRLTRRASQPLSFFAVSSRSASAFLAASIASSRRPRICSLSL